MNLSVIGITIKISIMNDAIYTHIYTASKFYKFLDFTTYL